MLRNEVNFGLFMKTAGLGAAYARSECAVIHTDLLKYYSLSDRTRCLSTMGDSSTGKASSDAEVVVASSATSHTLDDDDRARFTFNHLSFDT